MAKPTVEVEVELASEFKRLGCPYGQEDERSLVWLKGFKAGLHHGGEVAREAVRECLSQ